MSLSTVGGSALVGTAGWSYPHWNGLVYPRTYGSGFHPLEYLARRFDAVEINSSFYQDLKPEVVRLWMKKVEMNPRFQFTAKLHQRFTHSRTLDKADVQAFCEGLRPMLKANKLGALLMQFPWSFRFTAENKDFFIQLRRTFHEFPLVAEMRHSSWMAEEAVGVFLDYRVGFCNIDQPEYTKAMPPTAFLTSGVGYARLHGRNPQNSLGSFRNFRSLGGQRVQQHDYLYSDRELVEWAKRIDHIKKFADRTFVIFNNDAQGKSVVNALQIQAMLGGARAVAPKDLRRKFPVELERFGREFTEQQSLFSAA